MAEQRPTQDTARPDPFELWRQFYEANEQAWTKAIKDMTTTPNYVEAQGKMLEVFLAYQKMMRDAMSTQLNALNLPTRDDVGRLGELVVGLEEKIDQIDDGLAGLEERAIPMDERLSKVDGKVDQLVGRLGEIDGKIAPLSGKLAPLEGRLADVERKLDQLVNRLSGMEDRLARAAAGAAPRGGETVSERPARASGRASRATAPEATGGQGQ